VNWIILEVNGLSFREERVQISVVVPVRNGGDTIRCCLDSLKQSDFPEFEVIVVDDCSNQDLSQVAREYGFRGVRLTRPSGSWRARNKGAELAKGDVIIFVDCDMIVPPHAIRRIHDHFSGNHYAAVSGICGAKTSSRRLATMYKNLWMYHSYTRSPEDFGWFISGIGAVKREVFFDLEGFDSEFDTRTGGGDLEFGRRIKEAGRDILLDKALLVEHLKPYSLWSLLRNDFNRSRGWLQLVVSKRMVPQVVRKLRIANIYPAFMISVMVSWAFVLSLLLLPFFRISLFFSAFLALTYLVINHQLLRLFRRRGGTGFLLKAVPLSLADHLASGLGALRGLIGCIGRMVFRRSLCLKSRSASGKERLRSAVQGNS
jgi:glycosyltransferase involved in cell wall biosynthesis